LLVREHPEIIIELIRGRPGIKLPGQPTISLAPTDMRPSALGTPVST